MNYNDTELNEKDDPKEACNQRTAAILSSSTLSSNTSSSDSDNHHMENMPMIDPNMKDSYRDHSRDPKPDRISTKDALTTFPMKLHAILSNPEFEGIISWLSHGRAWRILQHKTFEEKVIPLYFRHGRYSSFARQVNGWGFRRITHGPDYNAYYHELFLRGLPHLCEKMKRLTPKDIDCAKNDSSPLPNFYSISRDAPLPEVGNTLPSNAAGPTKKRSGSNSQSLQPTFITSSSSTANQAPNPLLNNTIGHTSSDDPNLLGRMNHLDHRRDEILQGMLNLLHQVPPQVVSSHHQAAPSLSTPPPASLTSLQSSAPSSIQEQLQLLLGSSAGTKSVLEALGLGHQNDHAQQVTSQGQAPSNSQYSDNQNLHSFGSTAGSNQNESQIQNISNLIRALQGQHQPPAPAEIHHRNPAQVQTHEQLSLGGIPGPFTTQLKRENSQPSPINARRSSSVNEKRLSPMHQCLNPVVNQASNVAPLDLNANIMNIARLLGQHINPNNNNNINNVQIPMRVASTELNSAASAPMFGPATLNQSISLAFQQQAQPSQYQQPLMQNQTGLLLQQLQGQQVPWQQQQQQQQQQQYSQLNQSSIAGLNPLAALLAGQASTPGLGVDFSRLANLPAPQQTTSFAAASSPPAPMPQGFIPTDLTSLTSNSTNNNNNISVNSGTSTDPSLMTLLQLQQQLANPALASSSQTVNRSVGAPTSTGPSSVLNTVNSISANNIINKPIPNIQMNIGTNNNPTAGNNNNIPTHDQLMALLGSLTNGVKTNTNNK